MTQPGRGIRPGLLAWALLLATATPSAHAGAAPPRARPPDGGGTTAAPIDDLPPVVAARLAERLARNLTLLERGGRLASPVPATAHPFFAWPLRQAMGFDAPGYHGIGAFVDHDPTFPDHLLDWICGDRTYDTSAGYNHAGSDLFTWPFAWLAVDQNQIEVVAAAAGTIVDKADGNPDHRCGCTTDDPNLIRVQHADGSIAWYLHMKSGSLTAKGIGQTVATGEYLGVVASSGCSSGPHLHFEVHAVGGAVLDPWYDPAHAACNAGTAESWWLAQRPYYDSAVNALATHDAPPEFPPCPQTEIPHFSDRFDAGAQMVVAVYYRDEQPGDTTQVTIYRPDGSVFDSWLHTYPGPWYAGSYWYWFVDLPAGSPAGDWRFTATYRGQTFEHRFRVGLFVDGLESGATAAWSGHTP